MAIARIVATIFSDRIRPIELALASEYETIWRKGLAKIREREGRKGEPAELVVTFEWRPAKRSMDQLKLFWVLIEMAASMYRSGPEPESVTREEKERLYEDYLERLGPRVEAYLTPQAEEVFRATYDRVLERTECENGMVYVKAIVGASAWTMRQASEAIDYWMNELAGLGVPVDNQAALAHHWREWRTALGELGMDIADLARTQEEYKERTPICEASGTWIGTGGELAHIVSRGAGGDEGPWNWLHLSTEMHRFVQHQSGWEALLKMAPWLKEKVRRAKENENTSSEKAAQDNK